MATKRRPNVKKPEPTLEQLADEFAAKATEVILDAPRAGPDVLDELSKRPPQGRSSAATKDARNRPSFAADQAVLDELRLRLARQRKRLEKVQVQGGDVEEERLVWDRLSRRAALLQIHVDRFKTKGAANEEVAYWARRYGVPPEALKAAVATHGPDIDAVDAALGGEPPWPGTYLMDGLPRRADE